MARMIECCKHAGSETSFKRWWRIRSPPKVLRNFLIITLCKYLPASSFKNSLYRSIGMKIGKNVSVFGTNFDIFFPEFIDIGDNVVIGQNTTIVAHEFLPNEWHKGRVKIGKNALIGTMVLVLPGVEIGKNTKVAAYSLVNKSVGSDLLVGGVPIRVLGV